MCLEVRLKRHERFAAQNDKRFRALRTKRVISWLNSVKSWLILTVGVAGIPLVFAEIAFYIFEKDMNKELIQLTSFFFESTFGSLFIEKY